MMAHAMRNLFDPLDHDRVFFEMPSVFMKADKACINSSFHVMRPPLGFSNILVFIEGVAFGPSAC